MTPTPRRRGPLFYGLLAALLGVWGAVAYLLADGLADADAPAHPPQATASALARPSPMPSGRAVTYRSDFRDPFKPPYALLAAADTLLPDTLRTAPPVDAGPRPEAARPVFALHGIFGRTALLADEVGAVVFAQAGDTVWGTYVVDVEAARVLLRQGEAEHVLALTR